MLYKKLMILFALAGSFQTYAQLSNGKNMVKVNLSAVLFKGLNLQYERQVANKFTVALGYSHIPESAIAFQGYINDRIDNPNIDISRFRLGTSIFTPEVRYYFSKKGAFNGFYLAGYGRIGTYKIEGPINYTTSQNATRSILLSGKLNSITGGLMAGCSFKLTGKLYLDWWILGGSIGSARGNFNGTTPLTSAEQEALNNELEDIEIPSTTIKHEVNSNGATVTSSGTIYGVRGLGINLGIRF